MTADSQWPLQQGVYTALRADATLQSLTGVTPARIFDHVPQSTWEAATFPPFVVIGDSEAFEWDTKSEDGMEQIFTIDTWTRDGGGKKVLKQIMSAVVDALDKQALSVTGHDLVMLLFEFSDTMLEDDGITRHGVQRFRAVTEAQ